MKQVALGTEDELSEAIGRRLLGEADQEIELSPILRRGGNGYLRSKMRSWREIATQQFVVLFTDLDATECPPTLLRDWLGNGRRPEKLLIRVAVREIESWLLADHVAMRELLGRKAILPTNPDSIHEPKEHLLRLVERYAGRNVKDDLLVKTGVVASQGLGYNARLSALVASVWNPARAAERSESLRRARVRLSQLAQQLDL